MPGRSAAEENGASAMRIKRVFMTLILANATIT